MMKYRNKHTGCIGDNCPHCPKLDDPDARFDPMRAALVPGYVAPRRSNRFKNLLPCVHRGTKPLRNEACVDCVNVRADVFSCVVHGECTIGTAVRGKDGRYMAICSTCSDRRTPGPVTDELSETDKAMQTVLDAAIESTSNLQPPASDGRGIVMSAGGPIYFTCAWVCIWLLRHHGCRLPIEVYYLGRGEMDADMAALLESFGQVRCIDATTLPNRPRIHHGWQNKIFALQNCSFRQALFLDADQVPVRDPTHLFDTPQFRERGAIFWDDLQPMGWTVTRTAFAVARLPIPAGERPGRPDCPTAYRPFETGQVLIDRSRPEQWRALAVAGWIAERSDYWWRDGTSWLIYGDKDAFYLAWERLNAPYAMPQKHVSWVGSSGDRAGAFMQHDFQGELLFQHRCQPSGQKWNLHGANDSCGPRFKHFDLCEAALDELRRAWSGNYGQWHGADVDVQERDRAIGRWMLIGPAQAVQAVQLGDGGTIDADDPAITHWHVWRAANGRGPLLVLSGLKGGVHFLELDRRLLNWSDQAAAVHLCPAAPPGWRVGGTIGTASDPFEYQVYPDVIYRNEYRLADLGGGLVVDVGANVGCFVKAALDRGAGHVIAIEPVASNFERLQSNVTAFCDATKATLLHAAAWRSDRPATTLFAKLPIGAMHSGGWSCMYTGVGDPVPAVPFDELIGPLLAGCRIRLLKLDCEGAEFPILYTTRLLPQVDQLALEWHEKPDIATEAVVDGSPAYSGAALAAFLEAQGFAVEMVTRVDGLGMIFARRP